MVRRLINITIFASILFCFLGCANVDPSIFKSQKKVERNILPLELHFTTDELVSPSMFILPNIIEPRKKESWFIIYRESYDDIFSNDSEYYGYVIVSVKRSEFENISYAVISGISLCTLNLLGFPFFSFSAEEDVDLSILDSKKNVIATYSSEGKDTEFAAMYWGYGSPYELSQAVHTKALINAIDSLKDQIGKNASQINEKLLASGPIKEWCPALIFK